MYNKDYVKAIKYMHEENIFSYPEGHQLHESNIHAYTDWLQEHGKDTLADVIRHHMDINKDLHGHPDLGHNDLKSALATLHEESDVPGNSYYKDLHKAYSNDIPVVNRGYKSIWIYHPHKLTNSLKTYFKDYPDLPEANEAFEKLKEEGLHPL